MDTILRIFGIMFAIQLGVLTIGLTFVFVMSVYTKSKHMHNLSNLQELISNGDVNIKYRDKNDKKNNTTKVDSLDEIVKKLKEKNQVKDESEEVENPYER